MIRDKTEKFSKKIKIKFKNINLLKKSLTHKSFNKENNNEKLEFLGDRVLGLIISKHLLEQYPNDNEGTLDKKFAFLVNRSTCSSIAKKINIKDYIIFGDSYKNAKKSDDKIISDCLEALIGAIFLDSGFKNSENFVKDNWKLFLEKSNQTYVDAKTKLQEYCLKKYKTLPKYETLEQSGPHHNPIFKVTVQIPQTKKIFGSGNSIKNAQQNAAKKIINFLEF